MCAGGGVCGSCVSCLRRRRCISIRPVSGGEGTQCLKIESDPPPCAMRHGDARRGEGLVIARALAHRERLRTGIRTGVDPRSCLMGRAQPGNRSTWAARHACLGCMTHVSREPRGSEEAASIVYTNVVDAAVTSSTPAALRRGRACTVAARLLSLARLARLPTATCSSVRASSQLGCLGCRPELPTGRRPREQVEAANSCGR